MKGTTRQALHYTYFTQIQKYLKYCLHNRERRGISVSLGDQFDQHWYCVGWRHDSTTFPWSTGHQLYNKKQSRLASGVISIITSHTARSRSCVYWEMLRANLCYEKQQTMTLWEGALSNLNLFPSYTEMFHFIYKLSIISLLFYFHRVEDPEINTFFFAHCNK